MKKLLTVLAGVSLLAGCGSKSASDFCTDYTKAIATKLSSCSGGPQDVWQDYFSTQCVQIQKGITNGHIKYDSSHEKACIDAVNAVTCAGLDSAEPAECTATVSGTVAAGGACIFSNDCAVTGSQCASTNGACGGTCVSPIAIGGSCANGVKGNCVSGSYCNQDVCTANPASSGVAKGGDCHQAQCASGLACDAVSFTCVDLVKEGGACVEGHRTCETFTSCASAKCTRWGGAGSTCGVSTTGEYTSCLSHSFCKTAAGATTGTCTADLAAGATCGLGDSCGDGNCVNGTCAAACTEG
jgi:hypothetical protein